MECHSNYLFINHIHLCLIDNNCLYYSYGFAILAQGYGRYDTVTGLFQGSNDEITCQDTDTFCQMPTWRNNTAPLLNLVDPPVRDSFFLAAGGYAVIRFKTNNPGKQYNYITIFSGLMCSWSSQISNDLSNMKTWFLYPQLHMDLVNACISTITFIASLAPSLQL